MQIKNYFWKEALNGKSYWRSFLFEFSKKFFNTHTELDNNLKVLEMGATVSSSHQRSFPEKWEMFYTDYVDGPSRIREKQDYVFDANIKFPLPDNSFDGVVCYNTLPNIKEYEFCVKEMIRVSSGFVIFTIPLVAPQGEHPYDWTRITHSKLYFTMEEMKKDKLFSDYEMHHIGGIFSSIATLFDNINRFYITRIITYPFYYYGDKFISPKLKTKVPTQFFVYIQK